MSRVRYFVAILFLASFFSQLSLYGQSVDLHFKNRPVKDVIQEISDRYGYEFIFDARLLRGSSPISGDLKKMDIKDALAILFRDQPFAYRIEQKRIVLVPREKSSQEDYTVRGRIIDSLGKAIPGVTVHGRELALQTVSNERGEFAIRTSAADATLYFHHVAYDIRSLNTSVELSEKPV